MLHFHTLNQRNSEIYPGKVVEEQATFITCLDVDEVRLFQILYKLKQKSIVGMNQCSLDECKSCQKRKAFWYPCCSKN